MIKFSIIIPALNEATTIATHLSALQTLRNQCEIILADGGSVDETTAIATPFIDQLVNTSRGRAKQMNTGAKQAQGEILVFLHADTDLPEHGLLLMQQAIDNGACWGRFDIQLSGNNPMLTLIAFMMNWRSGFTGIATGDQVIFVTRRAFYAAGQFPEIAIMEDIALSSKLRKLSKPACLKAQVVSSGRRWENNGMLRTILLMWYLRIRFFLGADPDVLSCLYTKGKFC